MSRELPINHLRIARPERPVNAAGWVRVDEAEIDEAACHRINAVGAIALAQGCAARAVGCLNVSSDLVFVGDGARPLIERDPVRPLSAYGRSKVAMERGCAPLVGSLVVRTAALFSPDAPNGFATRLVSAVRNGRPFAAADDHVVTSTYVPALVDAALDLLIDGEEGVWHLSSGTAVTWADFARRIAVTCNCDPAGIRRVPGAALGWRAHRPRYVPLASERGNLPSSLDAALALFARHLADRATRTGLPSPAG